MGLFKTLGNGVKGFAKASEDVREFVTDTFISPVARELIRPVVNVRSGIDGMVPGGRDGGQSVNTPFGVVKPLANVQKVAQGQSAKEQGALKPGEAAMGAFEVLTAGPSGTVKGFLKPVSKLVSKADKITGASKALKGSAIKQYEKALAPTTNKAKALAKKIAPQLADQRVVKTAVGFEKMAQKGLEETGQKFNELGKMKGNVKLAPIAEVFEKAKSKYLVDGKLIDQRSWRVLDEIQNVVGQFGDEMPAQSLRELGRVWDEEVAGAGGFVGKTLDEGKVIGAKKIGANAIRELLAVAQPDFAAVNKSYSFFKNLDEVLEASKLRKTGQTGLARKAAGAIGGGIIGSSAGPVGAGVASMVGQQLAELGASTAFRTMDGAARNLLADVIAGNEHNLPKVIEYIKKWGALGAVKTADFKKYLESDAKLTPEELSQEQDAREQRIDEMRQRFEAVDETEMGAEVGEAVDPERQQRIDAMRQRFLDSQK